MQNINPKIQDKINKIIYFDYSQREEFESVNSYLESRGVKI